MAGPIAIYGATGYTGRLVAREARRRDLELVLAGRSADRLHALARELELDAPVRVAATDDRVGLRHAFGDCAAVINCAGPFMRLGEPVVRAAVETATHYVDTTGEQPYMQQILEGLDDAARAAEVAVVPAVGFDYLPGDLLSRLVARGREPLRELVVAYAVSGFAATRGTMHSAVSMLGGQGLAYDGGAWRPAGVATTRATFAFPEPFGRQAVTRYPGGEVVTAPRHTRTRRVTTLIATGTFAPLPGLGSAMALAAPALNLALRTPARALLDVAIDRLPEGPPEEVRRRAEFAVVVVAQGEDGSTGRGLARGRDVYGLTAASAVHAAALMTDGGYDRAGALAPAQAYDPASFLDHLGGHGLTYEVAGVAEGAPA